MNIQMNEIYEIMHNAYEIDNRNERVKMKSLSAREILKHNFIVYFALYYIVFTGRKKEINIIFSNLLKPS